MSAWVFRLPPVKLLCPYEGTWHQEQTVNVPDEGLNVWLKDFGEVMLFRTLPKHLKDDNHFFNGPSLAKVHKPLA